MHSPRRGTPVCFFSDLLNLTWPVTGLSNERKLEFHSFLPLLSQRGLPTALCGCGLELGDLFFVTLLANDNRVWFSLRQGNDAQKI